MPMLRHILQNAAILLITLCCTEAALRVQQLGGPLYDLDMSDVSLDALSDITNHKPIQGSRTERLTGKSMFGHLNGHSITRLFDERGIRIYADKAKFENCSRPLKILFLGDSFMEGYDDEHTIPYQVAISLASKGLCVSPLNVGLSSYSPAIFVPQARVLLPMLKPDYVVVAIDETDIYDDNVRYKTLIQRDGSGRNVGVKHSRVNYIFNKGFIDIREEPLYLVRLLRKLYHAYIRMPRLKREIERQNHISIFQIAETPHSIALDQFRDEVTFFKANLVELVDVIHEAGPGARRTIFIRHPHLQHLRADSGGKRWNSIVGDAVTEVAAVRGVKLYDGQNDLSRAFGEKPEEYYWRGDMHFNFDGLAIYSKFVADFIFNEIARAQDGNDDGK